MKIKKNMKQFYIGLCLGLLIGSILFFLTKSFGLFTATSTLGGNVNGIQNPSFESTDLKPWIMINTNPETISVEPSSLWSSDQKQSVRIHGQYSIRDGLQYIELMQPTILKSGSVLSADVYVQKMNSYGNIFFIQVCNEENPASPNCKASEFTFIKEPTTSAKTISVGIPSNFVGKPVTIELYSSQGISGQEIDYYWDNVKVV